MTKNDSKPTAEQFSILEILEHAIAIFILNIWNQRQFVHNANSWSTSYSMYLTENSKNNSNN